MAWERQEGGVAKVCLTGMKWELRRTGVVEGWRIPNLIKTWWGLNFWLTPCLVRLKDWNRAMVKIDTKYPFRLYPVMWQLPAPVLLILWYIPIIQVCEGLYTYSWMGKKTTDFKAVLEFTLKSKYIIKFARNFIFFKTGKWPLQKYQSHILRN